MKVKINNQEYEASMLTLARDQLDIRLVMGNMTAEELIEAIPAGSTPEVRELNDDGTTKALYAGRKVLEIGYVDGGSTGKLVMQVDPLEQSEADKLAEQLACAEGVLSEHDAALVEVAGMAADGQQMTGEAEDALVELAALYAALETRVAALEGRGAPDEMGEEVS